MKRNLKRNLKKKLEKRSTNLAKAFPAKGVKVEGRKEETRQAEDEEGRVEDVQRLVEDVQRLVEDEEGDVEVEELQVEDEADEEESDKPSEDRDILNTRLYYGIKLNFFSLFILKTKLIKNFVGNELNFWKRGNF